MSAKEFNPAESSRRIDKWKFCSTAIAANTTWMMVSSFLTIYYTNCVSLSTIFVGNMMLICRIFDGFSDIIAGSLIEKTHTRWGKVRPWFVISAVPMIISFVLMFSVPSGSTLSREIYAVVTYILFTVVFYTLNNISYQALLPRFSPTSADRSSISSMKTVFTYIAILGVNMSTTVMLGMFGGMSAQTAWTKVIVIFAIISLVSMLPTFFIKETVGMEDQTKDNGEDGKANTVPLSVSIKALLKSKYFYICLMLFFTYYITNGTSSAGIYFATYVVGNANAYSLISLASMLPSILVMPFVPKVFKKFGKRNSMIYGLVLSGISCAAMLINPQNITLYLILSIFKSVGTLPMVAAMFTLAGDVVDYNEMKTGVRTEGLTTSANGIGQKLGTGLGSALLGWLLAFGKFDSTLSVQPDSAVNAIIVIVIGLPIVIYIVAIILLRFWDLEKYQADILAFRKNRRQAKA